MWPNSLIVLYCYQSCQPLRLTCKLLTSFRPVFPVSFAAQSTSVIFWMCMWSYSLSSVGEPFAISTHPSTKNPQWNYPERSGRRLVAQVVLLCPSYPLHCTRPHLITSRCPAQQSAQCHEDVYGISHPDPSRSALPHLSERQLPECH